MHFLQLFFHFSYFFNHESLGQKVKKKDSGDAQKRLGPKFKSYGQNIDYFLVLPGITRKQKHLYKVSLIGEKSLSDKQKEDYFDLNGLSIGGIAEYAGFKFAGSFANVFKSGLAKNPVMDVYLTKSFNESTEMTKEIDVPMPFGYQITSVSCTYQRAIG